MKVMILHLDTQQEKEELDSYDRMKDKVDALLGAILRVREVDVVDYEWARLLYKDMCRYPYRESGSQNLMIAKLTKTDMRRLNRLHAAVQKSMQAA
jgi:hypothetical protein